MSKHIEIIARAILICGDHVLLCRHPPGNYLVCPGGHVEFGEPAAVALARELREEIGLDFPIGPCLTIQEHLFRQKDKGRHEINLMFHVEHRRDWDPASPPRLVSPEAPKVELTWVHRAAIAGSDVRPEAAAKAVAARFSHRPESGGTETVWIADSSGTRL